jgi:extracellular elastinolytic metalloproteinase
LTHVYVRQLINGLEVSDGDINLNIDSTGRVVSWGNSFHPSSSVTPSPFSPSEGQANEAICSVISESGFAAKQSLDATSGPWGFVKSAAKAAFGIGSDDVDHEELSAEVVKAQQMLDKARHHQDALCRPLLVLPGEQILTPTEALAHILPVLQADGNMVPISADDLESHPEHTFAPKAAPAEPPTEKITGRGLKVSGVVNPVPARLMYTQIETDLPRMVWMFEIEMKENWYEAYVDVYSGELVRIVDWASDISWSTPKDGLKGGKQKPLPAPHKKQKPYSYQVFPWGESFSVPQPLRFNP